MQFTEHKDHFSQVCLNIFKFVCVKFVDSQNYGFIQDNFLFIQKAFVSRAINENLNLDVL